tara:strand:- start:182 stop:424 length:243 start_codon:yes stop_codon:yes gene_type:complete
MNLDYIFFITTGSLSAAYVHYRVKSIYLNNFCDNITRYKYNKKNKNSLNIVLNWGLVYGGLFGLARAYLGKSLLEYAFNQ